MIVSCALTTLLAVLVQAQASYYVDNDGYIRNWLGLQAIALEANAGVHTEEAQKSYFEKEYFPRQRVITPADGDKVTVDSKDLVWKVYQAEDPCWKFDSPVNNSLYFVVAYVIVDQDIPNVRLSIGSDDSSLWSLNYCEVLRIYAGRGVTKDTDKSLPLTLNKGVNILQAMVINGNGEAGVSARFLDKNGDPVKDIKIDIRPPPPAPAKTPAKAPPKEPVAAPAGTPAKQ